MSPNDFGKKLLVDQCQKIELGNFIKISTEQLKEVLIKCSLKANGQDVSLNKSSTGFGGTRFWFACPICSKNSGVLYMHPKSQVLGCRRCLKLDYRKHRYKGMIEENTS